MAWEVFFGIINGVASGILAGAIGYFKSAPNGELFDYKKFVPPLIIGGIAGFTSYALGIDLLEAQNFVASAGVVALTNNLWLGLIRILQNVQITFKVPPKVVNNVP